MADSAKKSGTKKTQNNTANKKKTSNNPKTEAVSPTPVVATKKTTSAPKKDAPKSVQKKGDTTKKSAQESNKKSEKVTTETLPVLSNELLHLSPIVITAVALALIIVSVFSGYFYARYTYHKSMQEVHQMPDIFEIKN